MRKVFLAAILVIITFTWAVPAGAYVIAKMRDLDGNTVVTKWKANAFPITWRMNPIQGANVTGSRSQADVFAASFAAWQALTTASLSFTQGAVTDAVTTVKIDNINMITTNPLDGTLPTGVLALTATYAYGGTGLDEVGRTVEFAGQIMEADIYFSAVTPFTTNTTAVAGRLDLQSVATHEIGHFLGLDHSSLLSATMFWTVGSGVVYPRTLSGDDIAAVSILYPAASFALKGKISGSVRTTANVPVYGAIVVAVNAGGSPVASTVTDPSGAYTIEGLDAGAYTVYAEPLDGPIALSNITSLPTVYPGAQANSSFTTRYR
jgi:hypothetical protein